MKYQEKYDISYIISRYICIYSLPTASAVPSILNRPGPLVRSPSSPFSLRPKTKRRLDAEGRGYNWKIYRKKNKKKTQSPDQSLHRTPSLQRGERVKFENWGGGVKLENLYKRAQKVKENWEGVKFELEGGGGVRWKIYEIKKKARINPVGQQLK